MRGQIKRRRHADHGNAILHIAAPPIEIPDGGRPFADVRKVKMIAHDASPLSVLFKFPLVFLFGSPVLLSSDMDWDG